MKIQIVSDLHIEHRPDQKKFKWRQPGVDVLVVAGDACDHESVDRFRSMLNPFLEQGTKVVYVAGNHEAYQAPSWSASQNVLQSIFGSEGTRGIHLLEKSILDLPGGLGGRTVRFIGTTLWSDLYSTGTQMVVRGWPDFRQDDHDTKHHHDLHVEAVAFLHDACYDAREDGVIPVVVTHFCPSFKSCHPRYAGDSANPYFLTDLEWIMNGPEAPDVWIHGHTHDRFDYMVNKTRVICNPYGYPGESAWTGEFNPNKVIEV